MHARRVRPRDPERYLRDARGTISHLDVVAAMSSGSSKRHKPSFSLSSLVILPCFLAPAFMAPIYYRISHGPLTHGPYFAILAQLGPPTLYAGFFSLIGTIRIQKLGAQKHPSVVFRAIRTGAVFGALFSAMAHGPMWIFMACESFSLTPSSLLGSTALQEFAKICVFASGGAVGYAFIGAAAGSLIGIFADLMRRDASERPDEREHNAHARDDCK